MNREPDRVVWRPLPDMDKYRLQGLQAQTQALPQCGCIGPQRGEPVCPCQMASVKVVDGRYVMTRDLGPAPEVKP